MTEIKEFINFFIGLTLFIVLLFITYWFVRRKLPNVVGGRFAKVISKTYIDRNTYLALVMILKEYYVILVSSGKAEVIKRLDTIDEGEIEETQDFKDLLHKFVGGKK
ncbi:MAG: flagellar biosynthetic protein FliO [Fervidobacterium sp.]